MREDGGGVVDLVEGGEEDLGVGIDGFAGVFVMVSGLADGSLVGIEEG